MYPYELFFGITAYDLLMIGGFLLALVCFRLWADRLAFSARLQNLVLICALGALLSGYGFSVLTQAFYNFLRDGVFRIDSATGATFYGGLVGGAGVFLLIYFIAGRFFVPDGEIYHRFFDLCGIGAVSITLAHGVGRIGCLVAGCCYGKVTDAWYGVYNVFLGAKTVPVQLFEALFLFLLTAILTLRLWKRRPYNLAVYLMAYAVWRFFIEYLRNDERGGSLIPALSPSQFASVLLLLLGVALLLTERVLRNRKKEKGAE